MKKIIAFCLFELSFINCYSETVPQNPGPLAGKMYFSDKPFITSNAGSKTSFKSSDFIYGRLELDNQKLKDAFRLPDDGKSKMKNKNDCYLRYSITIEKGGHENLYWGNNLNYLYVPGKEKNNTWFNFDVLPAPAEIKSFFSMLDDFSAGFMASPLYKNITPGHFPENGEYTIRVRLYLDSYDGWGRPEEQEKWPMIEGEFNFTFDSKDIAALKANGEAGVEAVKLNVYRVDQLPDIFANPAKITDPKLTPAKISAIFKRDMPERSVIKYVFEPTSGPLWFIDKDDYGLPRQRYFSPDVYVAYKKDGKCLVGTLKLVEKYEGGGKYGPLQVAYTSASNEPDKQIDCSKVK